MVNIQDPNKICLSSKKKEKFVICVDMDGVISGWLEAACKVCNIDLSNKKIREKLKAGTHLDKIGIISDNIMWKHINAKGTKFWSNLEVLPWAKKLLDRLSKVGDVYILTSPGTCVPAASGKMEWIEEHFPDYIKKLIITRDKHLFAAKNRVLVDDTEKKIKKFREYGGHAFLWPNDLAIADGDIDADETIDSLVEEIKSYQD